MPTVSAIVPTHNRAALLGCALGSVFNQTFQDFEILVVDDNSQDDTRETVAGFADRRIVYVRHDTNQGVASARNTGILKSTGRYVAFLDDDDEWLPAKLQLQVDLLASAPPVTGAVYTGSLKVERSSGRVLDQITPTKRGDIFGALVAGDLLGPTSTVCVKRECFDVVGLFDETIGFGEDVDMWRRIARISLRLHRDAARAIHEGGARALSQPRSHDRGHRGDAHSSTTELFEALEPWEEGLRSSLPRLGRSLLPQRRPRKGREAFVKGMRLYPFEMRQYFHFLLSLLGPGPYERYTNARGSLGARARLKGE